MQSASIAAYDALPRIPSSKQTTVGQPYAFAYGYNLDHTLKSITYRSGKVVAYGYDPAVPPTQAGLTTAASADFLSNPTFAVAAVWGPNLRHSRS